MADTVDKSAKRKRNSQGSSKPSKKIAIEGDRNIQISQQDPEKWAPIIVSAAGVVLPSIPFQPYTKPRANAPPGPGRSGAIATTEVLLHSSAHPKLDYTVREEDTLQKHYVGIYDPETGKLEVVEARKMEVRAGVRTHQATGEQVRQSALQSRIELGKLFGTKKAQKAIASMSENAIGPNKSDRAQGMKMNSKSAAIMASMADATGDMATAKDLQQQADASKPRPKANLDATDIGDVYTHDSLLGVDMLRHVPVIDWTQSIEAKEEIIVSSRHVARRIQKEASNIENLKILRYMLLLIDIYNAARPTRGGARMLPKRDAMGPVVNGMPEVVVESVKRRFTEGGKMSRFMVDLLITHVCALACLVDHYEVHLFDLQEDLKLEGKDIAKYFREIGAKVAPLSETQRKALKLDKAVAARRQVARLKLPLDFPKVSMGRKKTR